LLMPFKSPYLDSSCCLSESTSALSSWIAETSVALDRGSISAVYSCYFP